MKTKPIEIIIISSLLLVIIALSLILTSLLVPITRAFLFDYHVFADAFFFVTLHILISSQTVRILIKKSPLAAEEYGFEAFDMLSTKAFYWKTLTSITEMGGMFFMPFVPLFLRPLFFRLFGTKVGKDVEIAGKLAELPLITIEDNAFIGGDTFITAHAVIHDMIILKPVKICSKVTIGVGAKIMPGVEIGENSIVGPGSVVAMDTIIPPNEFWSGMPAQKKRTLKRPRTSKQGDNRASEI